MMIAILPNIHIFIKLFIARSNETFQRISSFERKIWHLIFNYCLKAAKKKESAANNFTKAKIN